MKFLKVAAIALPLLSTPLFALNAQEERYLRILSHDGIGAVKEVSQSVYKTREDNQQVLDQIAEQLLKRHRTATKYDVDALAWATKALMQSSNRRYYTALEIVAYSDAPKKLRKYAKKGFKMLKKPEGEQYALGMAAGTTVAAEATTPTKENTGTVSFEGIVTGMTLDEVQTLIGAPDSMQVYETDKGWVPFDYEGGDTVRQEAVYKNKGRIIYSNNDKDSGDDYKVSEVLPY